MCGIVGAYNPLSDSVADEKLLTRMAQKMAHRGPDGSGVWREERGRCGMAHRRLSIIDLSDNAAQPMSNVGSTVSLVFNGEIYNHAALRKHLVQLNKYQWKTDHSDTEVLLHAYEEWGLDCISRLQGMFAFAVYDARTAESPVLHLVRDRVGIKPLYITKTSTNEWVFSSEIRAMFEHPKITPEMDNTAFWHYLTFIVTPAPMTMFKDIFKIPAGNIVTIDHKGHGKCRQYWDIKPSKNNLYNESDLSEEEAVAETTRLLKDSVEKRMVADVPFGVLLSGGVDSSMNVALMSELMDRPVSTFTIGYEGEEDTNEFQYARRVSQRYKTNHHEALINQKDAQEFLPLLVQLQDEPIADNVCIPLYFLSKLVKDSGTTVVQVGEGADENMLGYWWVDHYRQKAQSVYDPMRSDAGRHWLRKLWSGSKSVLPGLSGEDLEIQRRAEQGEELFWGGAVCWWGDMRRQLTPDRSAFTGSVNCPVEGMLPESFNQLDSHNVVKHYLSDLTGNLSNPEVLQKIPYMEMKLRLPEHLLMRVDKLTMAHSVEARVPFLDHELLEFLNKVPSCYKLKDGIGKSILKKAAEPYLDKDIIYRKKQGFGAPMESWFKDPDFGKRAQAAFDRSRIKKEGYFDNDYFSGLLKHQMGAGGGYSFHIWTVLNAVLWHESWIEGNTDCF